MSSTTRRLAIIGWAVFTGNLIFAMIAAQWQLGADQLALLLGLVGYLLISSILVPIILAVVHRAAFTRWWVWPLLIGLWLLGGTVGLNNRLPGWLTLPATLLFMGCMVLLLAGCGILLFQRDLALPLMGIISLALVWSAAIAWQTQGDLIGQIFGMMFNTANPSISLMWVLILVNTMICLMPIAALSFLAHTIRAVRREIDGDTLEPIPFK
jgi:hypothetical protein